MTSRDYDIINFINKYKFATTSHIQHFFFSSRSACNKTMKRIVDEQQINRMRIIKHSINSEYLFFLKKPNPSQIKHSLSLLDFYVMADETYTIKSFQVQKKIGSICPDACMVTNKDVFLVEVELSHKGFDYIKYEEFVAKNEYSKYFNKMPTVIVYTPFNPNIPSNTKCNFIVLRLKSI